MSVTEAILSRRSIRAFRDVPVSADTVREILALASRAPSGGNLQPWRVHVLGPAMRDAVVARVRERLATHPTGEGTPYPIYPPDLTEPYRWRRRKVGEDLYRLIGVARDDRAGKLRQFARNWEFFGAPVGLILTIDRQMGPAQFVDLGLFLQNILLLAQERGLDSCAQEAWAEWHVVLHEMLAIPDTEMVFCGVALGHRDGDAVINRLETERVPVDGFATFWGF